MRELTKSMMSYTLAMSMFSVRQMVNLFIPREAREGSTTADSFNQLATVAAGQLGQTLGATFQAGDRWQRQVIDMIFSPSALASGNPMKWISKAGSPASEPPAPAASDAPVAGGPGAAPPSPTWSWGPPRDTSGEAKRQAPVPGPGTASPERAPTPAPPEASPANAGQDLGWGPMP